MHMDYSWTNVNRIVCSFDFNITEYKYLKYKISILNLFGFYTKYISQCTIHVQKFVSQYIVIMIVMVCKDHAGTNHSDAKGTPL